VIKNKQDLTPKSLPLQVHESIWASLHFLTLALVEAPMLPKVFNSIA